MYQPWFPLKTPLKPYPLVHCQLDNLSLTLSWQQDSVTMTIHFDTIAGLQVVDESSYQTYLSHVGNRNITFPLDEDLNISAKSSEYFIWNLHFSI